MIVSPTGQPLSSQPVPESREVTLRDLEALLGRMKQAHERMSDKNSHRALLKEAAWWLVSLSDRVMALQQAQRQQEQRIVRPGTE